MTSVKKYNLCKGISTGVTFGAPLVTLAFTGDFLIKSPAATISGAAVFALLLAALLLKDKLAEKFKAPSALLLAIVALVFCIVVENILMPIKTVALVTIIACTADELSCKRMYKSIEQRWPESVQSLKKFGFILAKQTTVDDLEEKR